MRQLRELYIQQEVGPLQGALSGMLSAVESVHNIANEPNETRLIWSQNLAERPSRLDAKQAEVLYFVGCVGALFPQTYGIPQSFVQIMEQADVDYAVLGGEEWCCGYPVYGAGMKARLKDIAEHHCARLAETGARILVTTCPSCYYTWRRYYPLEGVRLMHSAEFIAELVRSGRLEFRAPDVAITYHDPCDLGRGLGVYDAPREVLRTLAGDGYIELTPSRQRALCCGGGGDVEIWDPELVGEVNTTLTGAVEASGAQVVVQGCPQCKRTTLRGLSAKGSGVRSMDIAEAALAYGIFTDGAADD